MNFIKYSLLFIPFLVFQSCTEENSISLTKGTHKVVVNTNLGGRIIEFSLNGANILTDKTVSEMNHGSTLWPAPQSFWQWPPPKEIYTGKYQVLKQTENELCIVSNNDEKVGWKLYKHFEFSDKAELVITYAFENTSDSVQQVAPWEISCVRKGGALVVPYAYENYKLKYSDKKDVPFEFHENYAALQKENTTIEGGPVFIDGIGKMAYAYNDLLFVKSFDDVDTLDFAPNEGETLFYFSPVDDYIELENQGAFKAVQPGKKYSYTVKWELLSIDANQAIESDRIYNEIMGLE